MFDLLVIWKLGTLLYPKFIQKVFPVYYANWCLCNWLKFMEMLSFIQLAYWYREMFHLLFWCLSKWSWFCSLAASNLQYGGGSVVLVVFGGGIGIIVYCDFLFYPLPYTPKQPKLIVLTKHKQCNIYCYFVFLQAEYLVLRVWSSVISR